MANERRIQLKRPVSARSLPARWILVGVLLGMVSVGSLKAVKRETGFLNRRVTLNGETYRYQVYVPLEWNKGKKWPVILFLHGAGERGEDGLVQGGRQVAQLPPHPSTDGDVNQGNDVLEAVESEGIAGVQQVLLVGEVV